MTWYDSKRLISIIVIFFGVAALINTVVGAYIVPNTMIAGILLVMFGRSLYQEAELDKMDEKPEKI